MNKKKTLLRATIVLSAGIEGVTGCDNNAISSERSIERGEKKNPRGCSAAECLKFSAEVARCRDTDCKRYRLSKFEETVSRRSGGVSEGNFHPPRLFLPRLPSVATRSSTHLGKLATAAASYRCDIRCIRTSFPLNSKPPLRRHSSPVDPAIPQAI